MPTRPSGSKLDRIGDHVAALSLDLREWVELRIELAKTEVQEKVDDVTSMAKRKGGTVAVLAIAALLALYGLGFVFGAISAGFAHWLGHEAWGDLATALLLFIVVGILGWVASRRQDQDSAIEAKARVEPASAADSVFPSASKGP